MCIQEPGPYINYEYTNPNTEDTSIPFEIKNNNISSFMNWNKDPRYNLTTLIKTNLIPIIKKEEQINEHCQILTLHTEQGPISIINTYIVHEKSEALETQSFISNFIKDKNNIILCGDLNSYPDPTLDYFSTINTKKTGLKQIVNSFLN